MSTCVRACVREMVNFTLSMIRTHANNDPLPDGTKPLPESEVFRIAGPLWGIHWSPVESPPSKRIAELCGASNIHLAVSPGELLHKQHNCWWYKAPWRSYDITVMFSEMGPFRGGLHAVRLQMWTGPQAVHWLLVWVPGRACGQNEPRSANWPDPSHTRRLPANVCGHWGRTTGRYQLIKGVPAGRRDLHWHIEAETKWPPFSRRHFYWMKIIEFRIEFHLSLFLSSRLKIHRHWFR